MAHPPEIKDRARDLRRRGLTYDAIASLMSLSKSTVSLWTRDLPRPAPTARGVEARSAGQRRHFDERRARVSAERAQETQAWTSTIGTLSDREILLAGAVAYWAEGTKSKPWRPAERVVFTNSDVDMVVLFLAFLRLIGVSDDRIRLRLAIHESADISAASRFWEECLGVSAQRFQRPTLKRGRPRVGRRNVADGYHGCLVVGVLRSAPEYRRIEGIWKAVSMSASRLDRLSRVV